MKNVWILYKKNPMNHNGPKMLVWAEKLGIDAQVFCIENFLIKGNELYYENQKVEKLPKIVLFRGNGYELVDFFEKHNIRVVNSNSCIQICRDKWLSYNEIQKLDIPQPKTMLFENKDFCFYKEIYGEKFVIKNRYGLNGTSVFLIENSEQFLDVTSKMKNTNNYIVQEYIASAKGKDLRAYVIGDKIIGFVLRENKTNFRANTSQGGTATTITSLKELLSGRNISEQNFRQDIMKIAKQVGGEIISVDFLLGDKSLLICELNSCADFLTLSGDIMREEMLQYIKSVIK